MVCREGLSTRGLGIYSVKDKKKKKEEADLSETRRQRPDSELDL